MRKCFEHHLSLAFKWRPIAIEVTRTLIQTGELLQIEVLDHLIIGQGAWMSMREQRLSW